MKNQKYLRISMLVVALLMVPGCQWESCKRAEKQETAEQAQTQKTEDSVIVEKAEKNEVIAEKEIAAQKKTKKYTGVIEIKNKQEFDEILEEGRPVIVKFYSETCPPCKASKPVFKELSHKHSDINFVAVSASHSSNDTLFDTYGVQSYPTFVFIDASGKVSDKEVGFSKNDLENKTASFAKKSVQP